MWGLLEWFQGRYHSLGAVTADAQLERDERPGLAFSLSARNALGSAGFDTVR